MEDRETSDEIEMSYPEDLPISAHRAEIMDALRKHQVVVVCGDTGSGKTTQLPKMAMELGLGRGGRRIACTQPRRLAAVTVAERVAAELKTDVGGTVGYQHRFARAVTDETRVKFMTDGVLLAETRADPLLRQYDAVIIDEAHERSLNVDFLLGILKRILERRRDLKVVVSSATLDTEKFSAFFGNAPAIVVPGRLFPIETVYMPPADGEEQDLPRDVSAAIRTLPADGDVLVFLPGERDIRETADHLARSPFHKGDDVIPLLASLPAAEQRRAFRPSPKRRVILATNVAETSVTIPGIRAVVDSGLARISRYVHRTQVQRLQVESVSQASARQRAGRCGRVGPGVCIRLYSEEDFAARDPYTPPEVLRSSLAGVILTMLDLRLGAIEQFPFIDPPKPTMVREGLRELLELGAIHHDPKTGEVALTRSGRQLARIPVEPRLARIMLAASRLATLPSAIPVVAAMSCDDPRRRPVDERERADQAHAQFRVPGSDFLGTLKLWRWWDGQQKSLSQGQLRKLAAKTYLSYPKMREWRDLARQLADLAKRLKLDVENDNGGPDALHRALLTGLLSRIGHLDPEELDYRGAHGLRFALHPSSILAKKRFWDQAQPHCAAVAGRGRDGARPSQPYGRDGLSPVHAPHPPDWIVAGELVDTSRLFARNAAAIDPGWIEDAAGPICRHSYRDPMWDAESGFVRATEQVTLYGLVVVPSRRRDFSRIDPAASRRLFVLHALVLGEFRNPPREVRENMRVIDELRKRAERNRRPELFDAARLEAHFEGTVPGEIVSAGDLRKWLCSATPEEKRRFLLDRREWLTATGASTSAFPETIRLGNAKLSLSYRHAPDDAETDGITCTVRKSDATVLRLWRHDWLVPGALPEKVSFLLSSLPSALRRILSPIADTVSVVMPLLKPGDEALTDALRRVLFEHNGIRIPTDAWDAVKLPPHLKVRFRVREDDGGKVLAESRDLETALSEAGVADARGGASAVAKDDTTKHVEWDFGPLAASVEGSSAGWKLVHYPALRDEGDGVTIRLYKDSASAAASHEAGVTRLMYIALGRDRARPSKGARTGGPGFVPAVSDDALWKAIREAAVRGQSPIRSAEDFAARLKEKRGEIATLKAKIAAQAKDIDREVKEILWAAEGLAADIYDDIETQVAWLTYEGWVRTVPAASFARYPVYLKALRTRIARAKVSPSSDRSKMERFMPFWEQYREAVTTKGFRFANRAALSEYRWMLEEYRISLFAQEIGTSAPVSPKRLEVKWLEATEG